MYTIYIQKAAGNYNDRREGWYKNQKTHASKDSINKYNGSQQVEPVLTTDLNERKTWVRKTSAVKFANTLAAKVKTVKRQQHNMQQYLVEMNYNIRVIDLNTECIIHEIRHFKFSTDNPQAWLSL